MDDVLVSKTETESLYFKMKPRDPALDGRVVRGDETFDVPFWSYASKAEIKPITTTTFHKNLWNGSPEDPEWIAKFWDRETSFSDEELDSLKDPSKYTGDVKPGKKMTARVRMDKPASDAGGKPDGPGKQTVGAMSVAASAVGATSQKAARKPSSSDLDAISDAVGLDPLPQERITGDVLRGRGPRRGNLEKLLRYWRPIMKKPGGFRRCLVILADHPELYPLENICAWLHHETTGLWPNEGCHHPGMKNCRKSAIGVDESTVPRLRELKPKQKSTDSPVTSTLTEVDFKALAYMTASGTNIRVKSGVVHGRDPVLRTIESLASYAIPGDMSRIRKPIRSTLYRAATPSGGRSRIGGESRFRCPPGFANGGKFTDRRFTTCGPRLFEQSGAGEAAARRAGGAAAIAEIAEAVGFDPNAIGAKKPKGGREVTPGDYGLSAEAVREASVSTIDKANPKKVGESILVNSPLAYDERGNPGKLVRRDGSVLDLSAPISRIADVKDSDDMKDGYLISRVGDPTKMGDAEISTLTTNLRGFVLALPGGNHVKVSKTDRATPAAMKGTIRRFNALKDNEDPFEFASALTKTVDESKGALSMDFHMPDIKNPRQVIQIQRDGAVRSVVRWVYQLFLSETAPARNKATKPWTVVTADR
jgi:hypothetical protein